MAEDKAQLFTQEDILRCGCFPGKRYSPVKEGEYMKKGAVEFNDLPEESQQKLTEEVVLKSGVDGSEITWKDFLQGIKADINDLKIKYLRKKEKRFANVRKYYKDSLQPKTKPAGIDTIRDDQGHEIEENALTEQVIEKIKNALQGNDDKKKAYIDLYDTKDDKLVNNTNYNLSKIDAYKVALVIPGELLK